MIPDYQSIMLPLLRYLSDNKEHLMRDVTEALAKQFQLTEDERNQMLPSGQQQIFDNRVGWAKTYLKKAGLLESPRRAYIIIAKRGHEVLAKNPVKINVKFLRQFPEFIEFQQMKKIENTTFNDIQSENDDSQAEKTPDELIESGFNTIQATLGQDLLFRIRNNSPAFFEKVVLQLLENMGYGKGQVTGRSGDGGIDGFIFQDKLGLDKILFQAKRFGENTPVSASMLRDFIGTLATNEANKGVFITSSYFPKDAENNVSRSQKPIRLVDATRLVKLMIDFNIGVSTDKTYEIKKIDSDFFMEEE